MIPSRQIRLLLSDFWLALPLIVILQWKRDFFVSPLSRIPTAKNKLHHLQAKMGHDGDYPFREKTLWGPAIE
jgi:hypothetical protein